MKIAYDKPVEKGVSHLIYVGDTEAPQAGSALKILATLGVLAVVLSVMARKRR